MEPQSHNIYVTQSVWRRLKKGHIKLRDLQMVKTSKVVAVLRTNPARTQAEKGAQAVANSKCTSTKAFSATSKVRATPTAKRCAHPISNEILSKGFHPSQQQQAQVSAPKNKENASVGESGNRSPKRRRKKLIRLDDLIPKQDVKGGHKLPFGVTDATNEN